MAKRISCGTPALAQPLRILGPVLRQVEAVGDGQAGAAVGDRDGHRRLTVLLLAELAAILPRDADRMPSLLRKGGVIDNPGLDRSVTLERRRRQLAHLGQHPLVRPRRLADEMQQRLMLSGGPSRRGGRRHRLDALALQGCRQPDAVIPQRSRPVGMADDADQRLDIGLEARLAPFAAQIRHETLACSRTMLYRHRILTVEATEPQHPAAL